MKGHLGFRCRTCSVPGPVRNLRQASAGYAGLGGYGAILAWDAPLSAGSYDILDYRIEHLDARLVSRPVVGTLNTESTQTPVSWCLEGGVFRVSARNRCGWGPGETYGENTADWNLDPTPSQSYVQIYTSSVATIAVPCAASTIKAWCVGRGGASTIGGAGGVIAWKTWTRPTNDVWPAMSCVIDNSDGAYSSTIPSEMGATVSNSFASVTLGSQTITAYGALGFGNPGRLFLGPIDGYHAGGAVNQSGSDCYMGGAVAGWETDGGPGVLPRSNRIMSGCGRQTINPTYAGGVLTAVALAGGKVIEDGGVTPAFGAGAVAYRSGGNYAGYAGLVAGLGGGGFTDGPAHGPGCVVVQFQ